MKKKILLPAIFIALNLVAFKGYSQNVGIGQSNPASKLDLKGNLTVGADYSGTAGAPVNGAIIEGNVGIGTTSPSALLTVGTSSPFTIDNSGNVAISSLSAGSVLMTGTGGLLQIVAAPELANTYLEWDGTSYTWASAGSASVATLTPGAGLSGTPYNGSAPQTWTVSYGDALGTAVQGNTQITVNAGTGISGGGAITLGDGGTLTLTNTGILSIGISSPLSSTGGANPTLSLGTVGVANGGTGLNAFGGTNTILYTTAANALSSIVTANNGVLITDNLGNPSMGTTLPSAVQGNITSLGTITSGTWNGNTIAVANGGTGLTSVGADNSILTVVGGVPTWQAPATAGTVTSIGTGTGLTGGPINSSGTISIANTGVTANSYGSSTSVPTYTVNSQGQLTAASNVSISASGIGAVTSVNASSPLASSGGLTPNISLTGTVPVANGGTGDNTLTSNGVLIGNGTSAVSTTNGTSGQVIVANSSNVPSFVTMSGDATISSTGVVTVSGGGSGNGYIKNQDASSQSADYYISGPASIGTAPSSYSALTVESGSTFSTGIVATGGSTFFGLFGGTGVAGTTNSSLFGGIGVSGYSPGALSGIGVAGYYGSVPGSFIGSAGVLGTSNSSGTPAIYAYNSASNGEGLLVNGTSNLQGSTTITGNVSASGNATVTGTSNLVGTTTLGTTAGTNVTGVLVYDNSTNNNSVTIQSGATSANYTLTLPLAAATANGQVLTSSTGGTLSWTTPPPGTVTSVGLAVPTTIFSVSGSPITSSGTLTASLISQTANTFFAAPNGANGTPTFRSIVPADIPTLNQNTTGTAANVTGTVTTAHGGTGLTTVGGNGTVLTVVSGVPAWQAPATSGTVTSVATGTGLTGGTITSSGTISIANTAVTAASYGDNAHVAAFTVNAQGQLTSASSTAISASAIGAVTSVGASSPLSSSGGTTPSISLGTVTVANGGTGLTSYTAGSLLDASTSTSVGQINDVTAGSYLRSANSGSVPVWSTLTLPNAATTGDLLFASGTNAIGNLSDIATGNVLISGGTSTAPSWGKVGLTTAVSGVLPIANGGTNSNTALSGSGIMISNGTQIVQGAAGTATTVLHGNASGAPTYSAVSLTTDVINTLPVANGGTGLASATSNGELLIGNSSGGYTLANLSAGSGISITNASGAITIASSAPVSGTAGGVLYGTGAGYATSAAGTSGQVLVSGGAGAPTWAPAFSGTGFVAGTGLSLSGSTLNSYWTFDNSGTNNLYNNNTGNIGIGTTTPSALFSVGAGATSPFQINSSGAIAAATGITSSGTITFSGLTTGLVISSAAGVLSNAVAGTDYQAPMSSGTGISIVSNTISNTGVISVGASSPLASSGGANPSISLTGTVPVVNGGTGQTTASGAINALLPSQTGNSGEFLTTNGTSASWASVVAGVTSITGTANQVIASASTGAVTLSLPQSIGTGSSPTFAGLNLSGLTASSEVYTDASKNLTSTIPASGTLGFWTLSSGNLYPSSLSDAIGIGTSTPAGDAGIAIANGHIESQQTTAPTATVDASAGTAIHGASASLTNATDVGGLVSVKTESSGTLSTGAYVTVNFNQAYITAPIVVITPTDNTTAGAIATDNVYVTSSTNSFTINFGVKGANGTTYNFNYMALETH